MANQAHHRDRRYVTEGARLLRLANTNPDTVCCHCARTLDDHEPHLNGKPQTWTRGHTIPGSRTWRLWLNVTTVPPPGDWLAPAASRCNVADENDRRDTRKRTGYAWP